MPALTRLVRFLSLLESEGQADVKALWQGARNQRNEGPSRSSREARTQSDKHERFLLLIARASFLWGCYSRLCWLAPSAEQRV
jgi:hypothetical protein